jgi:hypothetical protein
MLSLETGTGFQKSLDRAFAANIDDIRFGRCYILHEAKTWNLNKFRNNFR